MRNSQPVSKLEDPFTPALEGVFDEWPELYQKLSQMHKSKETSNLSEELLNNLILQSQDRQNEVRQRLKQIQTNQKPNLNRMIQFKKRAGRYQPMKDGKALVTTSHRYDQGMCRRRSNTRDDLYQSEEAPVECYSES